MDNALWFAAGAWTAALTAYVSARWALRKETNRKETA